MDGRQKMKLNVLRKRRHHHKKIVNENANYKYKKPSLDSIAISTGSLDATRFVSVPPINHFSRNSIEVLSEERKPSDLENPSTSAVKDATEKDDSEMKETDPDEGYLEKSDVDGQSDIKSMSRSPNDEEEEDSAAVKCLNFTCQCCECIIS